MVPEPGDAPDLTVGFTEVDAQPDVSPLVAGMEATARWPSVRYLRAWEREHLGLVPGEHLIDVGCGLGDAALALAEDVAPGGRVLGLDLSEAMLAVARGAAAPGDTDVEFRTADASSLDVDDDSFDACRSERMLQWVPDVTAAVGEMVRVVRPGGRLTLIDSDWRTLAGDFDDTQAFNEVRDAMLELRGASANAGSQTLNICRELGLTQLECSAAAHVWTEWDPDTDPGPAGLFPMRGVLSQLGELGLTDPAVVERFLVCAETAGRQDRFSMSLTMTAVFGRVP